MERERSRTGQPVGQAAPTRVTWLGHSTVLVDMDGVRLLTDPALRPRLTHLRRTASVDQRALRGVDASLVSHVHFDHLDLPSLERLGRALPVVVPRGAGGLLRRRRFKQVVEIVAGEEIRIGKLTVLATPAAHDAGRGPFGVKAPSLGYVISGTCRIYFAGDTDVFDDMARFGPVDLALLPIWGWGASVGAGHLDPERAARALRLIRPSVAVPIHWGTYAPLYLRRPGFLTEPAGAFREAARRVAPRVEVRILEVGGSTDVSPTIRP